MKDPYRDPDAYMEYLATLGYPDSQIIALTRREFGGTITQGNVVAARKRIAKVAKPVSEPSNDDEFRRRKIAALNSNIAFKRAILRAAG